MYKEEKIFQINFQHEWLNSYYYLIASALYEEDLDKFIHELKSIDLNKINIIKLKDKLYEYRLDRIFYFIRNYDVSKKDVFVNRSKEDILLLENEIKSMNKENIVELNKFNKLIQQCINDTSGFTRYIWNMKKINEQEPLFYIFRSLEFLLNKDLKNSLEEFNRINFYSNKSIKECKHWYKIESDVLIEYIKLCI